MLSRMEVYMRRLFDCVLAFTLVSTALTCFSQQTDVAQFAVFGRLFVPRLSADC
jgi:hypothetical protein